MRKIENRLLPIVLFLTTCICGALEYNNYAEPCGAGISCMYMWLITCIWIVCILISLVFKKLKRFFGKAPTHAYKKTPVIMDSKCAKCGAPMRKAGLFCTKCGHKV